MRDDTQPRRMVVGVTGASGAAYARRLIACLCESGVETHLIVSPNGRRLFADELDLNDLSSETLLGRKDQRLVQHPYRDVGAAVGSGSFRTEGMIICPCSSNTLAAVAAGMGDNLLNRAAAVTLKEMRRLILVPREMPMSRLDLLNALRLSECGAVICPASPGFYMMPARVDDLVDFVVGKLLDLMHVTHSLNTRWTDQLARAAAAAGRSMTGASDA